MNGLGGIFDHHLYCTENPNAFRAVSTSLHTPTIRNASPGKERAAPVTTLPRGTRSSRPYAEKDFSNYPRFTSPGHNRSSSPAFLTHAKPSVDGPASRTSSPSLAYAALASRASSLRSTPEPDTVAPMPGGSLSFVKGAKTTVAPYDLIRQRSPSEPDMGATSGWTAMQSSSNAVRVVEETTPHRRSSSAGRPTGSSRSTLSPPPQPLPNPGESSGAYARGSSPLNQPSTVTGSARRSPQVRSVSQVGLKLPPMGWFSTKSQTILAKPTSFPTRGNHRDLMSASTASRQPVLGWFTVNPKPSGQSRTPIAKDTNRAKRSAGISAGIYGVMRPLFKAGQNPFPEWGRTQGMSVNPIFYGNTGVAQGKVSVILVSLEAIDNRFHACLRTLGTLLCRSLLQRRESENICK